MTRLYARAPEIVLIIDETNDGIYLYGFRKNGFIGDTWHQSVSEAKEQATFNYGSALSAWCAVPSDVDDLKAFADNVQNRNPYP